MNYLQVLDDLDDLMHNAKKIPFTSYALLSEEKIHQLLLHLRQNYPEEMKRSALIINQKEEMLLEAKNEAQQILKEAIIERDRLTNQQEVYQHALNKAEVVKKEVKNSLIELMREMNEALVNISQSYRQQCIHTEQLIEESYRQALAKFQEIKDNLIDAF